MLIAAEIAAWEVVLVLTWLSTTSSFAWGELLAAAALALPCACAAWLGRRMVGGRWRPPTDTPKWLIALCWAAIHDALGTLALAARSRPSGRFEQLELAAEPSGSRAQGREAVATIVTSATPGSLVVDSHPRHRILTVHTLPISPTRLTRLLRR